MSSLKKNLELSFDEKNFIWLRDFKLPFKFFLSRMAFQFYDKNSMRSQRRGTALFEVHIMDLVNFLINQKNTAICPVCFENQIIDVQLVYVSSEWALVSQCKKCLFTWRHDEWT